MKDVDVICFSHLRWNFVFQRPQHVLSRFARERRVFFIEEPLETADFKSQYQAVDTPENVIRIIPLVAKEDAGNKEKIAVIYRKIIAEVLAKYDIRTYLCWYYTPMALPFSRDLRPVSVVYDCMDELRAFKNAPPEIPLLETELLQRADVVFTGGMSIYERKRQEHHNVHALPSSVDTAHFAAAKNIGKEYPAQKDIPHPRVGFYGVLDERFDTALLAKIAKLRPRHQFVCVGPIVKISASDLPKAENIHYLGSARYEELPLLLAGWDVAMMPFAHNESTRFISPTKTLEYLAAGKRVVSTGIRDVVDTYAADHIVAIADDAQEFAKQIDLALQEGASVQWQAKVERVLAATSWEQTWKRMDKELSKVLALQSLTGNAH